ncbi:MAG: GTPase HflX [Firmicutes bacterium ADurb.Bin506]|nr:MAG: GTPase HflX [Firmicutes bacterium ADurb.Bin506]
MLSDTVGFIQKLPHQLIMAFRATLEEVTEADVLLHVVDASHPNAAEHCEAVFEVLEEIGASEHPTITVLNKSDLPEAAGAIERLRNEYPVSVAVSAITGTGLDKLAEMIQDELSPRRVRLELSMAYDDPNIAFVRRKAKIISEDYADDEVRIVAEMDQSVAGQLKKARGKGAGNGAGSGAGTGAGNRQ